MDRKRDIDLIIFDLDGTLVEFKINFLEARKVIIDELVQHNIPRKALSPQKRIFSMLNYAKNFLLTLNLPIIDIDSVINNCYEILKKFEFEAAQQTSLKNGVKKVILNLKNLNKKMGIFTLEGNEVAQYLLNQKLNLRQYFDIIVTRDHVDGKYKPHPGHLLKVFEHFGNEFNERKTLVVGDHSVDMECATNAASNALKIGISSNRLNSSALIKSGADFVINEIDEILDFIKED